MLQRVLLVSATLLAATSFGQDDDDLPALPAAKRKPAGKQKPKRRPPLSKPTPRAAEEKLPPLPPANGELLVKLSPAIGGARLTVDGKDSGTLPRPPLSLPPGEHVVEVRRLGYAPFTKKVTVASDTLNELTAVLDATAAVLTVNTDVSGARVYVNGTAVGVTPLLDLEVAPGEVEITVKKEGYDDGAEVISVVAGRDYPVEVRLGPLSNAARAAADTPSDARLTPMNGGDSRVTDASPAVETTVPVHRQWWFWTGIAVVVAVAVAVGVALAVNGSRGSGELERSKWPCYSASPMTCPAGNNWINLPSGIVPFGD